MVEYSAPKKASRMKNPRTLPPHSPSSSDDNNNNDDEEEKLMVMLVIKNQALMRERLRVRGRKMLTPLMFSHQDLPKFIYLLNLLRCQSLNGGGTPKYKKPIMR